MDLELSAVTRTYATRGERVEVLRGIDLRLGAGDSLVITGPSGSGKSTLLHIVGTLDEPTSGEVRIGGRDPFALPEPELARFRNRSIGFVFQDPHLLPQYSVLENALVPTFAFPDDAPADAEERAAGLLERVGLSHRLGHYPAELSGGERQRVSVARALVNDPGLLLCDEPTGSLDPETGDSVAALIQELHEVEQSVLLVVTHSLELASRFPRRVDLREGRCSEA